jgi:uncharacterized sodium:solute symporter family permease YidK
METKNYFKPVTTGQDNPLILGGTVETTTGQSLKKVYLFTSIADISTAGQIYIVSPVAGTITKIYSVINGAIATANSILTPKINNIAITNGAITQPMQSLLVQRLKLKLMELLATQLKLS